MKTHITLTIFVTLLLVSCGKKEKEDVRLSQENWMACATSATKHIATLIGGHDPKFTLDTSNIFIKPISDSNYVSVSGAFEATEEIGAGLPQGSRFEVQMKRQNNQWEVVYPEEVSITIGEKSIRKGY